jgi:hypothetical protein
MAEEIQLSPEQEKLVLDAFANNKEPSITELVKLAFPTLTDVDGRSKEGRAVKGLIAAKGFKARTTGDYQPVPCPELTDNFKEFIRNHLLMSPVSIARTLFANPQLSNLSCETRKIAEYMQTISPTPSEAVSEVPTDEYRPPRTIQGALQRVDKYIFNHKIKREEMTAAHKAGLDALLAYMNTFRFVHQINIYEHQTARDLFESAFVRFCYDKSDLTEEEVDQYIVLAHETVNSANIQARIETLQGLLDNAARQNEGERAVISMSLIEAINTLQTEYNQCVIRQNKLNEVLKQKRSDRLAERRSAHASVLNLVQLWKEEKSRTKFIHIADLRKQQVKKAAEELASMEDFKSRILGFSMEELDA